MQSPKSNKRPWNTESNYKKAWPKREHTNQKFYTSKAWRDCRKAYILDLQNRTWEETDTYILSLPYPVCERCLSLYKAKAYDKIEEGKELDHIDPVNPLNALDHEGYGKPFDHSNLQLLCKRHHSKKSNRDKRILKLKKCG